MNRITTLLALIPIVVLVSCLRGQPEAVVIYENDFEDDRLNRGAGLTVLGGTVSQSYLNFNGSRVFGRFGTGGINVDFDNLGSHDIVEVAYDLYIHDNWEGNGVSGNDPDVAILNIDLATIYFSSIVNTLCTTQSCPEVQSFPNIIGNGVASENANVKDPTLEGACFWKGQVGGTKLIRIEERRFHSDLTLRINIGANLSNAGTDFCKKSWSIDNLKITTLRIQDL